MFWGYLWGHERLFINYWVWEESCWGEGRGGESQGDPHSYETLTNINAHTHTRTHTHLSLGQHAHQSLAILSEGHHRGSGPRTLRILNHLGEINLYLKSTLSTKVAEPVTCLKARVTVLPQPTHTLRLVCSLEYRIVHRLCWELQAALRITTNHNAKTPPIHSVHSHKDSL